MEEEKLTKEELSNFTGTEQYHRLTILPLNCTDGIAYVAEKGKAFWLIDAIASYQTKEFQNKYPFQVWTLKVKDNKGMLHASDGNDNLIQTQSIPYTDFPLKEITLYLTDNVLLLPSEY